MSLIVLLKMSLIVLLKMGKGANAFRQVTVPKNLQQKKQKTSIKVQSIFKINNLGPSLFIGLINMVLC